MNKTTKAIALIILIAFISLIIGLASGYWLGKRNNATSVSSDVKKPLFYRNPMNPTVTSPIPAKDEMGMDYIPVYAEESNPQKARKILFYRNPMNPTVTSKVPMKDNMGMDYVPVYEEVGDVSETPGTVKIDPVIEQNMGVRTAIAKTVSLTHHIQAVGRVSYDEERIVRLHPKTEGWIESLRVNKTGQWVKKNEDLLSIYSPQLVASQQEYVLALNNLKILEKSPIAEIRQGAEDLVTSSRERLKLLDVPAHQLRDLTERHVIKKSLHIHAPSRGIIMNIGAREGQYVTPETELYMIADLSKIWVYADIYEYELPWISVGDVVEMQLAGIPGQTFKGRLAFIYPYAEAKTRTIKVRLEFDNQNLLLKPDMFAQVTIHAGKQIKGVVIPSEAVLRSGTQTQVFVVKGQGKFEPRLVTTGLASNNDIEILKGLKDGEEVVTSAQFLLDSESKLNEATLKMTEPQTMPATGEHHHD